MDQKGNKSYLDLLNTTLICVNRSKYRSSIDSYLGFAVKSTSASNVNFDKNMRLLFQERRTIDSKRENATESEDTVCPVCCKRVIQVNIMAHVRQHANEIVEVKYHYSTTMFEMEFGKIKCNICRVQLKNFKQLMNHKRAVVHLCLMQKKDVDYQENEIFCRACSEIIGNNEDEYNNHLQINLHRYIALQTCQKLKNLKFVGVLFDRKMRSLLIRKRRYMSIRKGEHYFKNLSGSIYCEVCDVNLVSTDLSKHLKSLKHFSILESRNLLCPLCTCSLEWRNSKLETLNEHLLHCIALYASKQRISASSLSCEDVNEPKIDSLGQKCSDGASIEVLAMNQKSMSDTRTFAQSTETGLRYCSHAPLDSSTSTQCPVSISDRNDNKLISSIDSTSHGKHHAVQEAQTTSANTNTSLLNQRSVLPTRNCLNAQKPAAPTSLQSDASSSARVSLTTAPNTISRKPIAYFSDGTRHVSNSGNLDKSCLPHAMKTDVSSMNISNMQVGANPAISSSATPKTVSVTTTNNAPVDVFTSLASSLGYINEPSNAFGKCVIM